MKPIIKKLELRSLNKSAASQPAAEDFPLVEPVIEDPIVEQPAQEVAHPASEYLPISAPVQEYPIFHSVANSGWQASEIGA